MGSHFWWNEKPRSCHAGQKPILKNRYLDFAIVALFLLLKTTKTVSHFGWRSGWNGWKIDDNVHVNVVDGDKKQDHHWWSSPVVILYTYSPHFAWKKTLNDFICFNLITQSSPKCYFLVSQKRKSEELSPCLNRTQEKVKTTATVERRSIRFWDIKDGLF